MTEMLWVLLNLNINSLKLIYYIYKSATQPTTIMRKYAGRSVFVYFACGLK